MNPIQCFRSIGCRWLYRMLGVMWIAMSLMRSVDADSPVVRLTNGALQWSLPKNPEFGWIVEQSSNLVQWKSLGDPLKVVPRPGPVLDLPLLQGQSKSFFRAVSADRSVRAKLLQEHWSRWKNAGLHTYEYEFRWSCLCAPNFTQWVRVAVVDSKLVSVRRSDDGRELPADLWRHYHTLDTLFEWIAKAFEENAARIEVTYAVELGYPLSGYIDYIESLADDERGFEVRFMEPPAAILLADAPTSWPGDPYVIEAVRREGDWLQVEVAYSGGCIDPHKWKLLAVPAQRVPGTPEETLLYLVHDAQGDQCEAQLRQPLTFGLSSIRAGWAAQNPTLGTSTVHILLSLQDPRSNPPEPVAVLPYEWDPVVFVPWRDVIAATAWHYSNSGVAGTGRGTHYRLSVRFPPDWGEAVQISTLWIGDRAFSPHVEWSVLPRGGGRMATLTAEYTRMELLQPDHSGPIGISEWPLRNPQAPSYRGAALLMTKTLGQTQEWPIPIIHQLP